MTLESVVRAVLKLEQDLDHDLWVYSSPVAGFEQWAEDKRAEIRKKFLQQKCALYAQYRDSKV